jgi:hypothetical protein
MKKSGSLDLPDLQWPVQACSGKTLPLHELTKGVLVKLNRGLPWQKLHLTRRRNFLPANWT